MNVSLTHKVDFVNIGPRDCDIVKNSQKVADMYKIPYTLYEREQFM